MSAAWEPERQAKTAPGGVHFVDSAGVAWRVTECDAARVPGARGPRCLIFASDGVVRRVWRVPPDWRTMSPAELEALGLARPDDLAD